MLIIGHRGASGYAPENTIASFRKALDLGVDMIEFDVQITGDGTPVVIHDGRVDRTTNGEGSVDEHTLIEIRQLSAGNDETIPTLEEALDYLDGEVPINVDLRSWTHHETVAGILEEAIAGANWSPDDILVSSFHHDRLEELSLLLPDVNYGLLLYGVPLEPTNYLTHVTDLDSVHLSKRFLDREFLETIDALDLRTFVYTVNDPAELPRLESLNIDGVFSDYPDRIAREAGWS